VAETFWPEVNGVAHTLVQLAECLRRDGHRVTVVRPRQAADRDRECRDAALVKGVALPGHAGLQVGLARPRTLRRLWTRERPDAVYVATEGPLGWSAVSAARRLGIRVLSGFHTNFHTYSRHYGLGFLLPVIRGYLTQFHRRADATIVADPRVEDHLRAARVARVHTLGRGVDGRLFTPVRRSRELRAEWGATDDDLVAIYVGRIAPEKNLPVAINAFRAIQRSAPASVFVLVGDGPARPALQRDNPDLIFAGVRVGEDLARHYASADLFLFPSETDTFGNVTLEAMASGLAVLAYDLAAAHQHITHGVDGLLAAAGNASAFVRVAAAAAENPERLAAIGRRARPRVTPLLWSDVARRFAALLCGDRSAGREDA
jgi:glycosyltransferase involved in cell wall biosynthesis